MPHAAASAAESAACVLFIGGVAIPFALLLVEVVRRGHPLRPRLTGALVGLAAGASAATLLALFHPFRPSLPDFAVHVAALAAVIAVCAGAGRALLTEPRRGEPMAPAPGSGLS
jgi:hypothetical protein